ncbi:hypothetical protein [Shimia sp.]
MLIVCTSVQSEEVIVALNVIGAAELGCCAGLGPGRRGGSESCKIF